jgi:RimJ/RimL family protein N-acetyltransferase
LAEGERGKGYASEALNAILVWLRAHAQVKAVKARCLADNLPSVRLLEKAGLKEVYRDKELIHWVFIKDEDNANQQ